MQKKSMLLLVAVLVIGLMSFGSAFAEKDEFETKFHELEKNYEESITQLTQQYEEQKRLITDELNADGASNTEIGKKLDALYDDFNQKTFQLKEEYLRRVDTLEHQYGQSRNDIYSKNDDSY